MQGTTKPGEPSQNTSKPGETREARQARESRDALSRLQAERFAEHAESLGLSRVDPRFSGDAQPPKQYLYIQRGRKLYRMREDGNAEEEEGEEVEDEDDGVGGRRRGGRGGGGRG
eukprot:8342149-Pyramimonas_sp.AAC.1